MKLLALDCSGLVAGVAVVEDDRLLGEYSIDYKKTHSETLLAMLDDLAKRIELSLDSLDAVAVAGGPGSFTGLRIGSATAKGLGLALDLPIISVPTVDALAYNLYGHGRLVCPLMDARRNQTYTGLYAFADGKMQILRTQRAVEIGWIVGGINVLQQPVTFLGDGTGVFREYLKEHCAVPYDFAPAHMNRQRAASVAALAEEYYRDGRTETAQGHVPQYLRLSQAERERLQKR